MRPRIKCRTDRSSALALFFGFHRASGVNDREILATKAATRAKRKGSPLPLRPLARLAQDEEPGSAGREARGRRGLEPALKLARLRRSCSSRPKKEEPPSCAAA
jgi:hypothetical protein